MDRRAYPPSRRDTPRQGATSGLGAEALLTHGARRGGGSGGDRIGLLVLLHRWSEPALWDELWSHARLQGPRLRRSPGAGWHELPQLPTPRRRLRHSIPRPLVPRG